MGRLVRVCAAFLVLLALALPTATAAPLQATLQPSEPLRAKVGLGLETETTEFVDFLPASDAPQLTLRSELLRLVVFERRWKSNDDSPLGPHLFFTGTTQTSGYNLSGAHIVVSHALDAQGSAVNVMYRGRLSTEAADCLIEPRDLRDGSAQAGRGPTPNVNDVPRLAGLPSLGPAAANLLTATCTGPDVDGTIRGLIAPHNSFVTADFLSAEPAIAGPIHLWSGLESHPDPLLPGVTEFVQRSVQITNGPSEEIPIRISAHDYPKVRLRGPLLAAHGQIEIPPGVGHIAWGALQLVNSTTRLVATGEFMLRSPAEEQVSIEGNTFDDPPTAAVAKPEPGPGVVAGLAVVGGLGAIWVLGRKLLALGLFSRLTQTKALEHDTRQQILQAVQLQPGASVARLAASLGLVRRTLIHHLGVMEQHRLVHVRRFGGRTAVYAHGAVSINDQAVYALAQARLAKALLALLHERPALSQEEIVRQVGASQPQVSRSLSRLSQTGLVRVEEAGRRRLYHVGLSPAAAQRVLTQDA